jgi:hypothetical protein
MRLYRLSNKNGNGGWVFAEDTETAKAIFFQEHGVKKISNIKNVVDQTDFYASSTDLADVKVAGLACLACSVSGPPKRSWCISREGKIVRDLSKGIGV